MTTIILNRTNANTALPAPIAPTENTLVLLTQDVPRQQLELGTAPDGTAVRIVSLSPALHEITGAGVSLQFAGYGASCEAVACDGAWLVIGTTNAAPMVSV